MTVPNTENRFTLVGDGATKALGITNLFFSSADLVVVLEEDATGVQTPQVITTHYTVAQNPDLTGTVTWIIAPPVGFTGICEVDITPTQLTTYQPRKEFPAKSHETALDRLTRLVQKLIIDGKRTVRLDPGEATATLATMPSKITRASKTAAYDAAGNPIVLTGITALAATITSDIFTGDGSTTDFSLSQAPSSVDAMLVTADGVDQLPTTDFTLPAASNLRFAVAPPSGSKIRAVSLAAFAGVPSDGSVTTAKLAPAINLDIPLDRLADQTEGDLILFGTAGAPGLLTPVAADLRKPLINQGLAAKPIYGEPIPCISKAPSESANGTDAVNDIDFQIGECRADAAYELLKLAAVNVKQIDVVFAEYTLIGTPSGGRDSADNLTGAKTFNTYLIGGAGKNTQGFMSTSLAPTLPAGFTFSRLTGSILWDGATIVAFSQLGDEFLHLVPPAIFSTAALGDAELLVTLDVPTGRKLRPLLNVFGLRSATDWEIYLYSPDVTSATPSPTVTPLATLGGNPEERQNAITHLRTNTSAQIAARADAASTTLRIATLGWIDRRGRDG